MSAQPEDFQNPASDLEHRLDRGARLSASDSGRPPGSRGRVLTHLSSRLSVRPRTPSSALRLLGLGVPFGALELEEDERDFLTVSLAFHGDKLRHGWSAPGYVERQEAALRIAKRLSKENKLRLPSDERAIECVFEAVGKTLEPTKLFHLPGPGAPRHIEEWSPLDYSWDSSFGVRPLLLMHYRQKVTSGRKLAAPVEEGEVATEWIENAHAVGGGPHGMVEVDGEGQEYRSMSVKWQLQEPELDSKLSPDGGPCRNETSKELTTEMQTAAKLAAIEERLENVEARQDEMEHVVYGVIVANDLDEYLEEITAPERST